MTSQSFETPDLLQANQLQVVEAVTFHRLQQEYDLS